MATEKIKVFILKKQDASSYLVVGDSDVDINNLVETIRYEIEESIKQNQPIKMTIKSETWTRKKYESMADFEGLE